VEVVAVTATTKKAAQHLAVAKAIDDGCDSVRLIQDATGIPTQEINNSIRALLDKKHLGRVRAIGGKRQATYWLTSSLAEVEKSFQTAPPVGYQAWKWEATELERAWPLVVWEART